MRSVEKGRSGKNIEAGFIAQNDQGKCATTPTVQPVMLRPVEVLPTKYMRKILIANRGEIAVRIAQTCRRLNLQTVAVYSDADVAALHVAATDEAVRLGAAPPGQSYLNAERVLRAAEATGADAIHPGYGFLSEDPHFARAVQAQGLVWIGPRPAAMEAMASKISARTIAESVNVPVVPGMALAADAPLTDLSAISDLPAPLLLKAAAGGGGIGMREVHDLDELEQAVEAVRAQAQRQFGNAALLIETLIEGGRHVEVQVAADGQGNVIHLYERDCSVQRRRQKLIEEAPAPDLSEGLRAELHAAAVRMATAVNYDNVGTVEFVVKEGAFYFLEMNTRLQVEHGVTEAVTGLDLVELQLELAAGQPLRLTQAEVKCDGYALETRVYAEDPASNFAPSVGQIGCFSAPEAARVDSGVQSGSTISPHYDGLLCKLITHATSRDAATRNMRNALDQLCVLGVLTNQRYLHRVLGTRAWVEADLHIALGEQLLHESADDLQGNTALIAATVWQFLTHPPAADQAPWPGGYAFDRFARWKMDGSSHLIGWRWAAADQYVFPDLHTSVRVIQFDKNGAFELEVNGERLRLRWQRTPTGVCLWSGKLGSRMLHWQQGDSGGQSESQVNTCVSPGPGQVLRIMVAPGQTVAEGDPLLVIESMKMESLLVAPRAATVASVGVQAGALITADQVLVSFEPAKGAEL